MIVGGRVQVVASSQATLKTMDGAAHGVYAYSKARADEAPWSRLQVRHSPGYEGINSIHSIRYSGRAQSWQLPSM
jgi:hypothetical protein